MNENEKRSLDRKDRVVQDLFGVLDYFRQELDAVRREAAGAVYKLLELHLASCQLGLTGGCPFCAAANNSLSDLSEG
jgi:hypothetical protein